MSVIAAALRELIAAGVTGDALVTAIENIENATLPKRTAHAARQARYRERHKASQSVTSDNDIYSKKEEDKKRKKVSTALPSQWLPSDAGLALAREQGWDEHKIKLEIHRFQDHAISHDRRQVDWQAAWRNWITSPFQQRANGHGKPKQSLVEIGRDLAERARAAELAAGIRREDDPIGSD